jgi:hypothetical protein
MNDSDNWYDLVDDMFENNYVDEKKPNRPQSHATEHASVIESNAKRINRIKTYPVEIQSILTAWFNATHQY